MEETQTVKQGMKVTESGSILLHIEVVMCITPHWREANNLRIDKQHSNCQSPKVVGLANWLSYQHHLDRKQHIDSKMIAHREIKG